MNRELKNCPFCGGEKLKIDSKRRNNTETYSVRCNKCHARGGTVSISIKGVLKNCGYDALRELREQAKAKAIEAWNARKPMEDIITQLLNSYSCYIGSLEMISLDTAIKIVEKGGQECL